MCWRDPDSYKAPLGWECSELSAPMDDQWDVLSPRSTAEAVESPRPQGRLLEQRGCLSVGAMEGALGALCQAGVSSLIRPPCLLW